MQQHGTIMLYGHPFVQIATFNKDFRLKATMNNDACLAYVKAGTYEVISSNTTLIARHNESILMKCGNYIADLKQDTETNFFKNVLFHLDPESIKKVFAHKDISFFRPSNADKKKQATVKIDQNILMDSFINSMMPYVDNPELATENLIEVKLQELIYILYESGDVGAINYILNTLFIPEQIAFKKVIEANLFNNLSIAELAHLAIRSESSFKRDFKKAYRTSPAKYIKQKRLEKAAKLLRSNTNPVSDIAWHCGFENVAHFSNAFRLAYGKSPRAYRNWPK